MAEKRIKSDADAGGGQKAAHQAEPPDLHRLLVDRVEDYAIFALDPDGYILTWNSGAARLKGYSPEEAIGQHFSIFYTPEDLAAGKPAKELEVAARTGRAEDEGWRVRKDGSLMWANVRITALRDDDDVLIGYAKATRDMTEQRAAEDLIRESEERFRLLVESVRDYAIFMLDPNGNVATWNAGAERIKGYSADEIVGRHFSTFYLPEDVARNHPTNELHLAIRDGAYEEEGLRKRKDGSVFWANVVITPVYGSDGRLAGFAKVTRDLTERRQAHERALADARKFALQEAARDAAEQRARELRDLADQLRAQAGELEKRTGEAEAANRAKSEFLAAMSHELRTPLNAIGGYTQLLEMELSGPLTEQQHDQLDRIRRSQQHLLGVINDILNFSRMEAGQVAYDVKPVPLQEVTEAVTPMVELQAKNEGIKLLISPCPPTLVALADRSKVEQILINLLTNATKFTPVGGEIELACGGDSGYAWVSVRDTGIGIPEEDLESIFAPFVQVGRTLSTPKEGTGLGLAISRDLARAMNGELSVKSTLNVGSTFTLILPRAGPAE